MTFGKLDQAIRLRHKALRRLRLITNTATSSQNEVIAAAKRLADLDRYLSTRSYRRPIGFDPIEFGC